MTQLFPEEERLVSSAVEARRKEFATVRMCARSALADIGMPPAPLLPGPQGAPIWPAGVVGSMTHCTGYRAAAVARAHDMQAVGVDAEPNAPLPDGLLALVTVSAERSWLPEARASRPDVAWDRVLFSLKESVYKAWYPLTRRVLDFGDIEARIDIGGGSFTATLRVPAPTPGGARHPALEGGWLVRDGLIITATSVPTAARRVLGGGTSDPPPRNMRNAGLPAWLLRGPRTCSGS
ncbi:4'-phosphopantetheinyl transferase superfamily protein (plasmid) [Streptomyces cynarae]|uniref:4'-phosphopantetheinyl transferase superfamily protein n=1 Tax=Streptomyces cynarae TaxID=2981134 RepID=A0ABY6EGH3_9ACTN|nr:4'-phosphopantetheinyl transferase superfamily protein [Streptomyces cynarae]UXY24896.1 4'-phosphopantetheinyl transferase superfamily protein [Streptomyces cynarae]